jgi:hypothetical protein
MTSRFAPPRRTAPGLGPSRRGAGTGPTGGVRARGGRGAQAGLADPDDPGRPAAVAVTPFGLRRAHAGRPR